MIRRELKLKKKWYYSRGYSSDTEQYTYEFDKQGNCIKEIEFTDGIQGIFLKDNMSTMINTLLNNG